MILAPTLAPEPALGQTAETRPPENGEFPLLQSLILGHALLQIQITDGRRFVGVLVGADSDARLLLAETTEYLPTTLVDASGRRVLRRFTTGAPGFDASQVSLDNIDESDLDSSAFFPRYVGLAVVRGSDAVSVALLDQSM